MVPGARRVVEGWHRRKESRVVGGNRVELYLDGLARTIPNARRVMKDVRRMIAALRRRIQSRVVPGRPR
eukprot:2137094-Rhodomonas_salina.1